VPGQVPGLSQKRTENRLTANTYLRDQPVEDKQKKKTGEGQLDNARRNGQSTSTSQTPGAIRDLKQNRGQDKRAQTVSGKRLRRPSLKHVNHAARQAAGGTGDSQEPPHGADDREVHARHSVQGEVAVAIDVDEKAANQNGNRPHERGPMPLRIIQPTVIVSLVRRP